MKISYEEMTDVFNSRSMNVSFFKFFLPQKNKKEEKKKIQKTRYVHTINILVKDDERGYCWLFIIYTIYTHAHIHPTESTNLIVGGSDESDVFL